MTLPEAIRQARVVHDLTQQELAETLGHSQSWVAKVERGHVEPSAGDLAVLSFDFGLTLVLGEWGVKAPRVAKPRAAAHA